MKRSLLALLLFVAPLIGCGGPMDDLVAEESQAIATPSKLVAFTPDSGWALKHINPDTGQIGTVLTLPPTIPGLTESRSTWNRATHRLYMMVPTPLRIAAVDPGTLQLVSAVAVARTVDIEATAAGQLVGVCIDGALRQFCHINPVTGTITTLNADLGLSANYSRVAAYSATTNLYYAIFESGRILSINATNGNVVASATLSASTVKAIRVNAANQLIGVSWDGAMQKVVRINPATGLVTSLASLPGVVPILEQQGRLAIDAAVNRLYLIAADSFGAKFIYTIDATVGTLLDVSPLPNYWTELHVLNW